MARQRAHPALPLEYSLVERNIEREHVPAALALGASITPWSPLASGLLTGKYQRDGVHAQGDGRLMLTQKSGNPAFEKLMTAHNWAIIDVVVAVAKELSRTPAQVALQWVMSQPGVGSTIIGATKLTQLEDNLGALDFTIPTELRGKLDAVSAPELVYPYHFFQPTMRGMINGGTMVSR
jgi:aryl-alcohol dehydrogenase-like predicted oxidoreductase